jgi:phosphoribosylformylglycinamidine synthase
VYVTLKPSVFDPQGRTVHDALQGLGFAGIAHVRQGKYFELTLEGVTPEDAQRVADEAARRVLSNPVIESYRVEVER